MNDSKTDWYIHHLSTALPDAVLPTAEVVQAFQPAYPDERTARLVRRLARHSSVNQRHLVAWAAQQALAGREPLYQKKEQEPTGPDMFRRNERFLPEARPLVQACFRDLPADAVARLSSLVTVTCTHVGSPGLENLAAETVTLSPDIDRWNLGFMGCSAALAGLRLIHQSRSRGDAALLACELSSLHFQYRAELDQLTANLLFADGCALAHCSNQPGPIRIRDARAVSLPAAADQMVWFADACGLRLHLDPALPATLAEHLPAAVRAFLAPHDLTPSDLPAVAVHPGGPQILDRVESSLALAPQKLLPSREVLATFGNMSSPTILFILAELFRRRTSGPCLALAFGPGLTIEMVLLDFLSDHA